MNHNHQPRPRPLPWAPAHLDHLSDAELLAQGYETGWWDEHGIPAPWPEDFDGHLPDGQWKSTTADHEPQAPTPGEPPF